MSFVLTSEDENIVRSQVLRGASGSTCVKSPARYRDGRLESQLCILNRVTIFVGYLLLHPYIRRNIVDEN
jgi:hypothetical protein